MELPRIVLGGVSSGVGKTTVTLSLLAAWARRGLRVAAFKCGPDYLDPTYHARASAFEPQNVDGWMMGRDAVLHTVRRTAKDADVALCEGVMGLFDGVSPTSQAGSTAEIAKWLEAPVVAVIDASGMARTIAAVARGLATFDPSITVEGVLANRVGSLKHLDLLRQACDTPKCLGGLVRSPAVAFPERHLGLRTANEAVVPDAVLDQLADLAEESIDLDGILGIARTAGPLPTPSDTDGRPAGEIRCRLGVARDEAFHFYYADNLRRLEEAGAQLVPFSPCRDSGLPDVDALLIGGGYPELHAAELSQNRAMMEGLRSFAATGRPVYAECGGLMLLCAGIRDLEGKTYEMAGLIPGVAVMAPRLRALGYVEVEVRSETPLGPAGTRFRGHQFRYSDLEVEPSFERAYRLRRRRGGDVSEEGYRSGSVIASYVHAHWASNPEVPGQFVQAAVDRRER